MRPAGSPPSPGSPYEELTEVGTWTMDMATGRPEWSPMMSRLCGWPADAPAPDWARYLEQVLPDDRAQLQDDLYRLLSCGQAIDSEHRLLVRGRVRVMRARARAECEVEGKCIRVWGATQDITGLRRTQDELAAERDASRVLLAAMADGYAYTEGGIIREVNDAFCRLTGFARHELIGQGRPYPFWPMDAVASATDLADGLRGSGGGEVELEFCRKDGTRFVAALTARPVTAVKRRLHAVAPGAAVTGYVTVLRDVTASRAERLKMLTAERMLVEAQAQARLGSWTVAVDSGEVAFSQQMLALCGLPADAPAPSIDGFLTLVHPEDRDRYQALIGHVLRDADYQTVSHRLLLPDGTVRHIFGTASVQRDPVTGRATFIHGSAQDVTDRVEREQALAVSEERFRMALTHSPIAVALVALDGRWLEVNDALADLLGYSRERLLALTFQDITHPDDVDKDLALVDELLAGTRDSYQLDKRYRRADGTDVWVSLHAAMVRATDGTPLHFVSHIIDISSRQALADALAVQASTDPLTGLANRRTWERSLLALCERNALDGRGFALAILDLDYFKVFNDTHGHLAGDKLLADAARAWTEVLAVHAPAAILARLGGEEFGVALPGMDAADAEEVMRRVLEATPGEQTASGGVTIAGTGDDSRSLMTRADAALYAAKRGGRDRCEILRP